MNAIAMFVFKKNGITAMLIEYYFLKSYKLYSWLAFLYSRYVLINVEGRLSWSIKHLILKRSCTAQNSKNCSGSG